MVIKDLELEQVQATLAKYRVVDTVKEKAMPQKQSAPGNKNLPVRDDFYEVLCDRVEQTLRQQGLDPSRDRAANIWRVLYYVMVATGLFVSGYFHITQVSSTMLSTSFHRGGTKRQTVGWCRGSSIDC